MKFLDIRIRETDFTFDDVMKAISEEALGLVSSIAVIIAGIIIMMDDSGDFGLFDHKGKFLDKLPWPFNIIREVSHHWWLGLIILGLGVISLLTNIIKIAIKLGILEVRIDMGELEQVGEKWLRKIKSFM